MSQTHPPGAAQYAELAPRAFCWSTIYTGCLAIGKAPTSAGQFAVHDGTDPLSLSVSSPSLMPPSVHLTAPTGCSTKLMQLPAENGLGDLRLVLSCRGLKRGARARVRIGKPDRVSFTLHGGRGSVRVQLSKPPGTAEPLIYLADGPTNKSCSNVRSQLRSGPRTFVLRVNANCGHGAGNTVAHLYIGGLTG